MSQAGQRQIRKAPAREAIVYQAIIVERPWLSERCGAIINVSRSLLHAKGSCDKPGLRALR